MTRSYCERCGRETFDSLPAGASKRRHLASCHVSLNNGSSRIAVTDCIAFAAGRRAAFKEAMKIARLWWKASQPPQGAELNKLLEATLKAPRRKA